VRRALLFLAVALVALGAPATAAAEDTVTLALDTARAVYGTTVTANGTVAPAAEGATVVVERLDELGTWVSLATASTDAAGAFSAGFVAEARGPVRARAEASGAHSAEQPFSVVPKVEVNRTRGRAFLGARLVAYVAPLAYNGHVVVRVRKYGRVVGHVSGEVTNGVLRVRIPTPGIGRFAVRLLFPEGAGGLDAVTMFTRARASARILAVGSRGADVRALERRLRQLRFRVSGVNRYFTYTTFDSVVAFQKAYGLSRTGAVGAGTWSMLGRARVLKPKFETPTPHIEINKTRQILMVVRNGAVDAIIPISSGATGNTPVGAFRILWKAPATSTWLGSAILYRTMTFHGNFAIHGYPSVPVYPASHGCVRVPMWLADWLYRQSPVGERIYIYY
jgi:N-acetylmuramoyl-L-alanine amidase